MAMKNIKLSDLCIGDGCIEKYILQDSDLLVFFKDYANINFKILFIHCAYVEEKGSVGFSLCKSTIRRTEGGGIEWKVYDDDGLILEVRCSSVKIEILENSQLQV